MKKLLVLGLFATVSLNCGQSAKDKIAAYYNGTLPATALTSRTTTLDDVESLNKHNEFMTRTHQAMVNKQIPAIENQTQLKDYQDRIKRLEKYLKTNSSIERTIFLQKYQDAVFNYLNTSTVS